MWPAPENIVKVISSMPKSKTLDDKPKPELSYLSPCSTKTKADETFPEEKSSALVNVSDVPEISTVYTPFCKADV